MSAYAADARYAWAMLGLAEGASLVEIGEALTFARAYRYATNERVADVERLALFFAERAQFGSPKASFEAVRKAYHKKAMALHPDRNKGNLRAEEELKAVNTGFEIVEAIHKEARDYFRRSEDARREVEKEAYEMAEREATAAGKKKAERTIHMSYEEAEAQAKPRTEARTAPRAERRPRGAVKFMAASVPRYIRNKRLFYLGRDAVIGSRLVKSEGSVGLLYDVIMLPEREFHRARQNLGIEASGSPALEMTNITPAYIFIDTKEILVPPGETNPHEYARMHFREKFRLHSDDG